MIMKTKHFLLERPRERSAAAFFRGALREIRAGWYRLVLVMAGRDPKIRKTGGKKYRVAVCGIFKDEGEFLREWLEYHLLAGIEHFYLYNNNSTDDYREILGPYVDAGLVTLVDFPEEHAQMKAYADAIRRYAGETEWMGFIDLDEFLVPLEGDTVYPVLERFRYRAGAVLVYWRNFGSSGLAERDPGRLVTEQFVSAYPKYLDIGKCFYNTRFEFGGEIEGRNNVLHHVLWCRWRGRWIPPVNLQNRVAFMNRNRMRGRAMPMQLNHYKTKSRADYVKNMTGKTDVFFTENPRSMDQFEAIDRRSSGEDREILRFVPDVKKRMGR